LESLPWTSVQVPPQLVEVAVGQAILVPLQLPQVQVPLHAPPAAPQVPQLSRSWPQSLTQVPSQFLGASLGQAILVPLQVPEGQAPLQAPPAVPQMPQLLYRS
jgi:hypothetical protein